MPAPSFVRLSDLELEPYSLARALAPVTFGAPLHLKKRARAVCCPWVRLGLYARPGMFGSGPSWADRGFVRGYGAVRRPSRQAVAR